MRIITHGLNTNPDDAQRDFSLLYSEHLTDEDILGLAAERGLAVGVLGSRALHAAQSWLGEQYEVNTAALRDLGFGRELDKAPEFDDVLSYFGMSTLIKFDRRRNMGYEDALVISPSMHRVGVVGTKETPGFIPRFDRRQGDEVQSDIIKEFWTPYGDMGAAHELLPSQVSGWVIAIMLDSKVGGLKTDPMRMIDTSGSKGIAHLKMTSDEQRRMLVNDQEDHEFGDSFELGSATLGQIMTRNAQLRVLGHSLLDQEVTFTRLVQYTDTPHQRRPHTPCIGSDEKGRVYFGASDASERSARGGIREVLQAVVVEPTEEEKPTQDEK